MQASRGKAKNKEVISFYTMPEYEDWVKSLGDSVKSWTIKYYKV